MTQEEESLLFGQEKNGPLSTFDAKIRIAGCLGILDAASKSDLDNIRHIRNGFAHSIAHHSFELPEIRAVCDHFRIIISSEFGQFEHLSLFDAKAKYVYAIALHHWNLIAQFPDGRKSRFDVAFS